MCALYDNCILWLHCIQAAPEAISARERSQFIFSLTIQINNASEKNSTTEKKKLFFFYYFIYSLFDAPYIYCINIMMTASVTMNIDHIY